MEVVVLEIVRVCVAISILEGSAQEKDVGEIIVMGNGMARVTQLAEVSWMVDPIEVVSYETLVDLEESTE